MIRGVLFDLDGVLYNGEEPIPGAAEAVQAVREAGVRALFVTNTTSRPRAALVEKLGRFGVPAASSEILTPPVAAAAWMRWRGNGLAALFVPEATRRDFAGLEAPPGGASDNVRFVVVGDLGRLWNYATLNRAYRLLHADPTRELVALGLTRYWQSSEGPNLDVAPFVAALECATGRQAVVMGKPAREFFQQAAAALGLDPSELLMVGDDLKSDVIGAQGAGLRAALVRTGKFRPSDLEQAERPDWTLDSVRDLPRLLAQQND